MNVSRLCIFTVLASFQIIIGDILQRAAAAGIDQLVTDGEQFVKRIVHGEKISENPGYLVFTAPYKLCEGDCKGDNNNFAMVFPMYIGKQGKEKYKEIYERDYSKIHSTKPNAPFKKRPTTKLFTLCPSEVTKEQTTVTPTESPMTSETEETLTETPTTVPTTETTVTETEATTETLTTETEATTKTEVTTETLTTETEATTKTLTTETEATTETLTTETESTLISTIDESPAVEATTKTTVSETEATTETPTAETTTTEKESSPIFTFEESTAVESTSKIKVTETEATTVTLTFETTTTETESTLISTIYEATEAETEATVTETQSDITTEAAINQLPDVPKTKRTAIKVTKITPPIQNIDYIEDSQEILELSETEKPKFTETDATETEDITFEAYKDTTDVTSAEIEETTFVTNANGFPCPLRICKKKNKVTPKIVTLVHSSDEENKRKLNIRNAQWNNDYSILLDSLYYY